MCLKKFTNNSLNNYGLCPSHYLSAPALSWDVILNITKVELELISNPDMFMFFEKGMRGGVSYISNRYSKASNKYLKSCDPKQESKHIYADANNLYGSAMSKLLPTSGFKWIDPKVFDLNRYTSNSSKGCGIEVDLEFPKELRKLHNDYPLAPDNIESKRELLSNYQLKIADFYNIPIRNSKKLLPNVFDKEKFVLHYENLQLETRIKTKKIHHILEFNQSQWLKPFVEFNTHKRIEAEKNGDKDEKVLYKLINNAVYGKTMENLRYRINVKLVNKKDYLKWTPKKIFDNNLVAIH